MSPPFTITADFEQTQQFERNERVTSGSDFLAPRRFFNYYNWLEDVRKQLTEIASLLPNWDSHGASSPKPAFINCGLCLLALLCQENGLEKPHINPTRDGGIQFEWESKSRYFELEIVGERAATYFYRDKVAQEECEGTLFQDDPLNEILLYIHRVIAQE